MSQWCGGKKGKMSELQEMFSLDAGKCVHLQSAPPPRKMVDPALRSTGRGGEGRKANQRRPEGWEEGAVQNYPFVRHV